jgi:hypothetical protein
MSSTQQITTEDTVLIAHLKHFCDKLFPGSDFAYTPDVYFPELKKETEGYLYSYYPGPPKNYDKIHKWGEYYDGLRIKVAKNLLDFYVADYEPHPGEWYISDWHKRLITYNIYSAFEYLYSVGLLPNVHIQQLPKNVFEDR